MTVFEFTLFITAAPDVAFRVVADPRSKLLWVPAIRRVEMKSNGLLGVGTHYLTSSGVGPIEFVFDERIVEWVEGKRLAYEGRAVWGYFKTDVLFRPHANEQTGTHVHYRMDYTFPGGRLGALLGRILMFFFRTAMETRAATQLKTVIERGLWQEEPQ